MESFSRTFFRSLSSVAYATEEILVALFAFGTLALNWSIPIAGAIVLLLIIVAISYRQTIESYPNGGGAYVVAKENLGQTVQKAKHKKYL